MANFQIPPLVLTCLWWSSPGILGLWFVGRKLEWNTTQLLASEEIIIINIIIDECATVLWPHLVFSVL
jgi:hypothetical protein